MTAPAQLTAKAIALRFRAAARQGEPHEEAIIGNCIDGVPVEKVEAALLALGIPFHRERLKLHYRAPGEMPKLVLD